MGARAFRVQWEDAPDPGDPPATPPENGAPGVVSWFELWRASERRVIFGRMSHHHIAALLGVWGGFFASLAGAAIAVCIAIRDDRRNGPKRFDFIASARRIRAMPIRARNA